MIVTASANTQLDELLEEICEPLQLSATQEKTARDRYRVIGEWLAAKDSPLASFRPHIYPQGSVRLKTTVRPYGQAEHDLDLVCDLTLSPALYRDPMVVYEMVERRLLDHGTYKHLVERFKRCLRIAYANEFHLDITPASLDPSRGGDCILVPDRKIREWKPSNPVGYSRWFEGKTLMAKKALDERKIDPLPAVETAAEKAPLRRAVQLIKRHRDVVFRGDGDAPRSIVLTTLAAKYYTGQALVSDALLEILAGIETEIRHAGPGPLRVPNPSNTVEFFCEAWAGNPPAYRAFVSFVRGFHEKVQSLVHLRGFHWLGEALAELFGEELSKRAFEVLTERVSAARQDGTLRVGRSAATLTTASVAGTLPVPRNTFFGT